MIENNQIAEIGKFGSYKLKLEIKQAYNDINQEAAKEAESKLISYI